MNKHAVYRALPPSLRNIAASTWGYYLRWWRYGAATQQLIEEALDRETWNAERWRVWQEEQITRTLHRAATKVPYYRQFWHRERQRGNRASWDYIENWPILEKTEVRSHPEAFVADDVERRHLHIDHTGGTTGRPTLIYESRATVIQWYAIYEARVRKWHNVSYKQEWGIFGGQIIVPLEQKVPPFWVRNAGLNQVYFSIFHMKTETAKCYIDAMRKYSPTHLIAYPSSLSVLAHHVLEQGLVPPPLRAIFGNSEKVSGQQRTLIQKAFNCPLVDTFGMAELTMAASECQQGTMHYWPEVGFVEVFDRGKSTFVKNSGLPGEFVMTSILNKDMPLIRYANGDIGELPSWDHSCPCGRRLATLKPIQGRANDLIQTSDGKKLYILDSLFNGLPIVEAQLIQESLTEFRVRLVPDDGFDLKVVHGKLARVLCRYLGDVGIDVQVVECIPRNANGKFKPFISKLVNNNEVGPRVGRNSRP